MPGGRHYQGTGPWSSKNPPVGPSASTRAIATMASGALGHGLVARVAVQVGGRVAGVDGVDLPPGQRLGVLGGDHVQCRLGRRVDEGHDSRLQPLGVGGDRERPHAARHHHDAGHAAPAQERQERMRDPHGPEQVHAEAGEEVGGPGLERPGVRADDAGVVHEDVEVVGLARHRGDRGHTEASSVTSSGTRRTSPPRRQLVGGGAAVFGVAGAEEHGPAVGGELAGGLEAEALVGSGDQCGGGHACRIRRADGSDQGRRTLGSTVPGWIRRGPGILDPWIVPPSPPR